ncbi:hypothetical protein BOX15_Mlig004249g3, partial [Macrostomum lignano]
QSANRTPARQRRPAAAQELKHHQQQHPRPLVQLHRMHLEFCYTCGAMLPAYWESQVACSACKRVTCLAWFSDCPPAQFQLLFESNSAAEQQADDEADGPDSDAEGCDQERAPVDPKFAKLVASVRRELIGGEMEADDDADGGSSRHRQKQQRRRLQKQQQQQQESENQDGISLPTVRRECQHCGCDRMYYRTMQTRSADEGQTVVYTCTSCSRTEVEFS